LGNVQAFEVEFMKFDMGTRSTGWLRGVLRDILQPEQGVAATGQRIGRLTRQGLAVVLSALMIMIPMGLGEAFAQSVPMPPDAAQPTPPVADDAQPAPQGQPLSAEQLDQLVAPIALYPDALVAQVLAAATYPTQVVEADRWRQAQGNAPAEQIAAGAENRNWDPSVKALTAFPTVLAQMDRNLQWTTDLGNAYYNQPQDVMDSVQAMRQKAQVAGQLRSTPQQVVANEGGAITIVPASPTVVYVPVYNPWTIWGSPFPMYPGYYYAPPPGIFWGGLAIGFGLGIGIGLFAHWGWGWGHWGMGWGSHAVFFNHGAYMTHSATVINRGFNRPGGPGRNFGARGAYARPGGFNRAGGSVNRASVGNRGAGVANRSGGTAGRTGGTINRSSASANRPAGSVNRSAANTGRPSGGAGTSAPRASTSHAATSGGGHPSGGNHPSGGGHSNGGGHRSAGNGHSSGHQGHGGHRA
jgi:hypothetical protein